MPARTRPARELPFGEARSRRYHGIMPAATLPVVTLKIERRSTHPWIFQKMVEKPAARIAPGSVVEIHDRGGQWVGRGFFNGHSRIALRVLTTKPEEPIDV